MKRKTKAMDDAVELALYQLATGATTYEIKRVYKDDALVEEITIERKKEPDLKAIQMWLSTKKPETWGELKNQDTGKVDQILEALSQLSESGETI